MRLIIKSNYDNVSECVAKIVKDRILAFKPSADNPFVLGLPTGSTPQGTYKRLVEYCKKGELSFEHVITFNMDEYVGLPVDHEQSYHRFMEDNLFKHIDIRRENIHILDGEADDLDNECKLYEEAIAAVGGIHLFLCGIGRDGHIAFNEPGSSLGSRTRRVVLTSDTILANARFFGGSVELVPKVALTVGVATVMDALEVIIIATGEPKAPAIQSLVEGPVSHMCTASALQMHTRGIVVVDEDATLELRVKTVRYFKPLITQGKPGCRGSSLVNTFKTYQ